jgi:hypothetical protein
MSRWLLDKTTSVLTARTSRRGLLFRSAVVGSALATNPVTYLLRPVSAYAAACQCRGNDCSCGTACCDGYTEFCCTITGKNKCPSGSIPAGWWKVDGSAFCAGAARYYMDCNQTLDQIPCECTCAEGSCNHRVTCCTHFRYGQCHQEIPQVGAIVCRVVTCTAPWIIDQTCSTDAATDQATALHDAPCLHQPDPGEEEMPPAPAVTVDSSGRQWVFVRGVDAALWAKVDQGAWFNLGGTLTSGPAAFATADGRVVVVVRGQDGGSWELSKDATDKWGTWTNLGGQS